MRPNTKNRKPIDLLFFYRCIDALLYFVIYYKIIIKQLVFQYKQHLHNTRCKSFSIHLKKELLD